jgi:hypothetical protein
MKDKGFRWRCPPPPPPPPDKSPQQPVHTRTAQAKALIQNLNSKTLSKHSPWRPIAALLTERWVPEEANASLATRGVRTAPLYRATTRNGEVPEQEITQAFVDWAEVNGQR